MEQLSLFSAKRGPRAPRFGGETFDGQKDGQRLIRQLDAVYEAMRDGRWHTLFAIQARACALMGRQASDSAVSARIRDLRKPEFGAHQVLQRRADGGTYEYRLVVQSDVSVQQV